MGMLTYHWFAIQVIILCSCSSGLSAGGPGWRCDVPSKPNNVIDNVLALGWDGTNPYCMSLDGKTCWREPRASCQNKVQQQAQLMATSSPEQQKLSQVAKPLVCGKALKAAAGVTGYEDKNHWCSIARAFLEKPARACLKQGKGMYSYSKKTCVAGKPGGAACQQHADCASNSCIFSCGSKGKCAFCKQDSDCPSGSKCWVTNAELSDRWAQALPMCGLTCNPSIGHVCACGDATARGNQRACPDGYYCTPPSFGDGCGPVPNTSNAAKCVKKSPTRLAANCEDIEGNVDPDESCEGPQGQQGLCLQSPDKRGLMWPQLRPQDLTAYRRCTHRCSSDKDCSKSGASDRDKDLAQLELCDTLKLTHPQFPTCIAGSKTQTPQVHQICTTRGVLPCAPYKIMTNIGAFKQVGTLQTACAVPERLLTTASAITKDPNQKPMTTTLEYGKCAVLCPNLKVGASCKELLPGGEDPLSFMSDGEYLAKQVCSKVRVVSPEDGKAAGGTDTGSTSGSVVQACIHP